MLIVGAGLSGIGCACWLRRELPHKRVALLEARADLGGTWDLFRYPGVRSDSDLFTFGYDFRPWTSDRGIAGGAEILGYLRETAHAEGVAGMIRYERRVTAADWDGAAGLWRVTVSHGAETETWHARWLFGATGYYDYERGHRPDFAGEETFAGPILHPQHWSEEFEPAGRRIAVIGSGATAITLVPALTARGAEVTQIQRTPTYVMPVASENRLHARLRRILPRRAAYAATRHTAIFMGKWSYILLRRYPNTARRLILRANRRALPADFPVERHFSPPYNPWDQRLCAAPDGDYFRALSRGAARIVTARIARFDRDGVVLEDDTHERADAIVTATGLRLKLFGGIALSVNGTAVDPAERLAYRGMMLDGVPNFAFAIGYTNATWTLKVGLLCDLFCRMLARMERQGWTRAEPRRPEGIETRPLLDFGAGYVRRALHLLPRQGAETPWRMSFDYASDRREIRRGVLDDPALVFSSERDSAGAEAGATLL